MQKQKQKQKQLNENGKGTERKKRPPPAGGPAAAAHTEDTLREVDAVDGGRNVYGDLRAAVIRTAAIAQAFGGHGSSCGRWEEV